MKRSDVIKYTSTNGYTGILYGKQSMAIQDKDGNEVMHTGFRSINTYDELVQVVEEYPEFRKMLDKALKTIEKENKFRDKDKEKSIYEED